MNALGLRIDRDRPAASSAGKYGQGHSNAVSVICPLCLSWENNAGRGIRARLNPTAFVNYGAFRPNRIN
jgi:hypothetical protein